MDNARKITEKLGGKLHGNLNYGSACCPCHDDKTPSMTIRTGTRAVIFKCHVGCASGEIVNELARRGVFEGLSRAVNGAAAAKNREDVKIENARKATEDVSGLVPMQRH